MPKTPRVGVRITFEPDEHERIKRKALQMGFDVATLLREAALNGVGMAADMTVEAALRRNNGRIVGELINHVCKTCGGRVMRRLGHGPTPGGNPIVVCTCCGVSSYDGFGEGICWCSFAMRGNGPGSYICVPFSVLKEKPWLREAFFRCGCDPDSGRAVIGVMLLDDYRRGADAPT